MTVETLHPAPSPAWLGQATAVEQARAVAEVAAAVQVAQMCPRDVTRAQAEMRRACSRFAMADRAFYSYKRGGKPVTGPTVYLAKELGRCFGNMQWGLLELRRDDPGQRSEMQAFAWDIEMNSRQSTTFVVPHARDVDGQIKPLESLRDVYENNANQGARRQREMILGLLPQWFVDEAVELCHRTLRKGEGDKSLEERIAIAVGKFRDAYRVDRVRLERHVGTPMSVWSEQDVADIGVVFRSLERGETTVAEQFPTSTVTAADLGPDVAPPSAPAAETRPGPAAPAAPPNEEQPQAAPIDKRQWAAINERFREIGVNGNGQAQARLVVMRHITGRADLGRGGEMTGQQGQLVLDNLAGETGPRLVTDVLRADNAPEHLIPLVGGYVVDPDVVVHQPAPTEEDDPGAATVQEAETGQEYDPTMGDDWPGAQQAADDAARDEAAAQQ